MRRREIADTHRVLALCEGPLRLGGAACTQLTSQTDTRTIAFARPAAKHSQTAICNISKRQNA